MRLFVVSFLAISLTLISNFAAAATGPSPTAGQVFGTANCSKTFPCDYDYSAVDTDIIPNANACIAQFFGYSNPNGLFDESIGIGRDGCLSARPNAIPKGMGAELTPHCCIVQQQSGVCAFHCDLVTK